ncbi:MAG: VIT domain-containing protein [bacterium]
METSSSPAAPLVQSPSWIRRTWNLITSGGWLLLFFSVILPLITLAVESATHMCADTFLDPLPTPWHAAAVAAVPLANLLAWLTARFAWQSCRITAGVLNGLALGLGLFFALLFLPLSLLGAFVFLAAFWYFGVGVLGLLPMTPALAFVGGLFLRRRLLQAFTGQPRGRLPGFRSGLALAFAGVLLLVSSEALTLVGIHLAASDDAGTQTRGIRLLRQYGRQDILLKACEDRQSPFQELTVWLLPDRDRLSAEHGRAIFYRVTGQDANLFREDAWRPFNSRSRGRPNTLTWDADQGGARIGGVLKGLSLYGSRYEDTPDEPAGLDYAEWTLTFRNEFTGEREARARIALPPGAVVSRLTLWIAGEEREAAFGGRAQTRQAYEKVVQRRRDPVLVTSDGPDCIRVQCFPVPANGEMKLRLGLTAPLTIAADGQTVTLPAPAILDRNFRLPAVVALPATRTFRLAAPVPPAAWAADTRDEPARLIQQTVTSGRAWAPQRVAIVIDGSIGMAARLDEIAMALTHLPPGVEAAVGLVDDGANAWDPIRLQAPISTAAAREVAAKLQARGCAGGRCNLQMLSQAWDDLAAATTPAALVWLHGPQPQPATSADDFRRRLERAPENMRFYAAQVLPGPCKITESLDGVFCARSLPPGDALAGGDRVLAPLLASWGPDRPAWRFERSRVESIAGQGIKAGDHLVRAWAADEVRRLLASGKPVPREAAQKLAVRWNLVTPVSGAVVLENQQQYKEAGLEPVAADSVPTVPEPAFWIILLLAAGAVFCVHRMRQHA